MSEMDKAVTKDEALAAIAKALADVEDAIQKHPGKIVDFYQKCKISFLAGQDGVEHSDWSRSTGLTLSQLALIHQFLFAASFVSAWYHVGWNKKRRDQAAGSYCFLVLPLGLDPSEVMQRFIKYEIMWRASMQSVGLRVGLPRKIGFLLVFFFIIAIAGLLLFCWLHGDI